MTPTNRVEFFDLTTYRWEKMQTTGKAPQGRHSCSAFVVKDRLFVLGGTRANDLFDRTGHFNDVYMLDLNSLCWLEAKISGGPQNIPPQMSYSSIFNYHESKKWIYLCRENTSQMESRIGIYIFDSDNFEFQKVYSQTPTPEARYHSSVIYLPGLSQVLVYGGYSYLRSEANSVCNEVDRLWLTFDNNPEKLK